MCGINGAFAYSDSAPPVDEPELLRARECMRSRGPDAGELWISTDRRVGLAHRRLAIIDLSPAGSQPMRREQNAIVFNGEIYNFRELRADLAADGVIFTSSSDTEVLLRLYEREQEAMLPRLRGMFSIMIWDGAKRRMLIARDPYGIKPLYYADDGGTFRAASQVKALVATGSVARQFDPAGAVGYFLRGSVPEPFTMYRAIRALPAGSFAWISSSGMSEPRRYFSIASTLRDAVEQDRSFTDAQRLDLVHDALLESVRYHMVSDVPVGAFLSAGIDSTSIVALAKEGGAGALQTLTLRFEEYQGRVNDEAPLAARIAEQYGLIHSIRTLSRAEFMNELPHVFAAMDQPSVDGVNSYFISKAAAGLGLKVALSGAGGDELFGGYTTFRDLPRWMPFIAPLARIPGLGLAAERLNKQLSRLNRHIRPKVGGMLRYGATWGGAYFVKRGRFAIEELPSVMDRELAEEGVRRLDILGIIEDAVTPDPGNGFARVAALESSLYLRNQLLRDIDWASMAHSLEVRVPLVDAHLLKKIAPALVTRNDRGKNLLAMAPRPPLPEEVRDRRKTGFTLPLTEWTSEPGAKREKRSWAKRVYREMFSDSNGSW